MMRIVCPSCGAVYSVPDALIGQAPRMVRCAVCAREWSASAEAVPIEAPLPPPPPPPQEEPEIDFYNETNRELPPRAVSEPPDETFGRPEPQLTGLRSRPQQRANLPVRQPPPPPRRGVTALAVVAWALSLLVLAGAATAAVMWRTQVVAAWPPSERVFAALGLR